ncbi:MAG: ATP-binding protein [Flavobacteriales bacterium]|nr:ATP-binding protein [Flavobacteriales bacterium]
MEIIQQSAHTIHHEVMWFERVVDTALTLYFKNESEFDSIYAHQPPEIVTIDSPYTQLIREYELGFEERLILILALIPHVKPQCLDVFLIKNQNLDCEFSEFGGVKSTIKSGFFPTLETACFILGGYDFNARFTFLSVIKKDHLLYKIGILDYDAEQDFGLHQPLKISNEYLGLLTTGKKYLPQFGAKFPAKEISTKLNWEDLIVDQNVMEDLTEVKDWLLYSDLILNEWELDNKLKPGYRVLFYGLPGTGKTMAASLLGKATNRPVFRVDLSLVVSKYIGETEKNLGQLFDEAEHKDWILFFDEADALFGKRTSTKGANDRYANQEVAYLLQRIEDFSGLVVLATNIQTNIDEAFSRRFQSMIHFPKPGKKERKLLWERLFQDTFELESAINLETLSDDYELSGGEMINVLRYCALEAAKRNKKIIELNDIIIGVRREYNKSNKTI